MKLTLSPVTRIVKRRRKPTVKAFPGGREVCAKTPAGRAIYRERTLAMAERQEGLCGLCGLPMGDDVTFDHAAGRGAGGFKRDDRIEIDGERVNAAVHYLCNGNKGSRVVAYLVQ